MWLIFATLERKSIILLTTINKYKDNSKIVYEGVMGWHKWQSLATKLIIRLQLYSIK